VSIQDYQKDSSDKGLASSLENHFVSERKIVLACKGFALSQQIRYFDAQESVQNASGRTQELGCGKVCPAILQKFASIQAQPEASVFEKSEKGT
jgi:hypothetical protein